MKIGDIGNFNDVLCRIAGQDGGLMILETPHGTQIRLGILHLKNNFNPLTDEELIQYNEYVADAKAQLEKLQEPTKIVCNKIPYRQGYIEVMEGIHPGCVNIEAWNVYTDVLDDSWIRDQLDAEVIGNVELELDVHGAQLMIDRLQQFIKNQNDK
jgi:hypothetical protein